MQKHLTKLRSLTPGLRYLAGVLLLCVIAWAAVDTLAPDSIAAQSGFTSCVLSNITDDPASPDGNWCNVGGTANINTSARVTFPTPTNPLTAGAGLQTFRMWVRKTSQSTNCTVTLDLYESGSLKKNVIASVAISSTTGILKTGTWSASDVTDQTGAGVEALFTGTVGGGGASNRASCELGAIAWDADNSAPSRHVNQLLIAKR